ncbi:MAG TPA: nuclear transport factor 2 family protein [Chitinophagaceae bacterium]|jgi:hypothetical protein|nr:nuclear transport factor 2 family protein [Chitinophagaceae bacterium]
MLKMLSFCLLMIASKGLLAQTSTDQQSVTSKTNVDLVQLSALNAQFIQDFLHNDTVAHNKIIYKDFVCIIGNGTVVSRDDYMKGWSHGYDPAVYKSFVMQNELIRIFSNTALVRAETPYTYISGGKEISGITIYTDTYIKLNGRWWCIQAQLTPKK